MADRKVPVWVKGTAFLAGALGGSPLEPPAAATKSVLPYPTTRKTASGESLFGVAVPDPYRWLEDEKSPEVRAWMAAQDRLARSELARLPGREALLRRYRELYYLDSVSAPLVRGDRYFYARTHADREKAIVYWRQGREGVERVLLDPFALSADGSVSLGTWIPAPDGRKVAYALRQNAADEATLHVLDVATEEVSARDVIEGAKYAVPSWTPDSSGFYYTYLPSDPSVSVADRPGTAEVRFHRLGDDPRRDALVHPRTGDARSFLGAEVSRDGRWLFLTVAHGWRAADVFYRDLQEGEAAWRPLVAGQDALYSVSAWQGRFYVATNEGAPRGRVFRVDAARPGRSHWEEIVPERKDAVLESAHVFGGRLLLRWLRNAASELEVRGLDGRPESRVPLPGLGTVGVPVGEPDQDQTYFAFSSFTHAPEVHELTLATGDTRRWSAVQVPVDAAPYAVEQVFYPSRDGTRVSMFVVRRKDMPRDGSTPFLLTGYGGFNISKLSEFTAAIFPWLEAGGGFALPNLRGGAEYGEDWHRAGMLGRKQNVFDDFLAAAEYLVAQGYTRPERLAITGNSNGGLLVGAALTQRPELFKAVACGVPLLDMVRYHLFGSGRTWIEEYGSAEKEPDFRTLFAYSPYHRVRKAAYPSVLFLSADSDDRVDPMHARKMTAALQEATTSGRPVLLRIEKRAGHTGADLVRQTVEQAADRYGFLMREVGLVPGAAPPSAGGQAEP